jgi:hypothetical protein
LQNNISRRIRLHPIGGEWFGAGCGAAGIQLESVLVERAHHNLSVDGAVRNGPAAVGTHG